MWTYRVVMRVLEGGEVVFGIHEAYDDGDITKPHSITAAPVPVVAESVEAVAAMLDRMKAACAKPVMRDERA